MKVFHRIADVESAVGEHLGYSAWHRITQDQIDGFADATGDRQWIHVNPAAAAEGPFGGTIAHGFLVLSLVPMLTSQVYRIDGIRAGVNYGADRLRFPAPVPVGGRVRAGVELTSVGTNTLGYIVATRVTIEREGGDKPACVVEMLGVIVP
jgi:acyl dehydratase